MLNIQGRRISDHLNLFRGLAAVAVLVYHVRYRFFFDYRDVVSPDAFTVLFYGLTAFGHDAVIIFFVLSGYFVSASVIRAMRAGRWSWRSYGIDRLTRLYVVLLPGLALTAFWDYLGLRLYGEATVYSGAPRPWFHDFFRVSDRLGLGGLGGNALFLQTIIVDPFGSNDPLWSLSNEFWYYALFPCACCALARPTRRWRAAGYGVLFGVILLFVGKRIAIYFPVWLLGALLCVLPQVKSWKRDHSSLTTAGVVALFVTLLVACHTTQIKLFFSSSVIGIDYVIACAFTLLLYFIFHDISPSRHGLYARGAALVASFSYTLYVVHIPLLVFLRAKLAPESPWTPDSFHMPLAAVIAASGLVYAFAISRVTESKTDTIRTVVRRFVLRGVRRDSAAEPAALVTGS